MSIDKIIIGNANVFSLADFKDAVTGAFVNDVTAFGSLCETPPSSTAWQVQGASNASPVVITSAAHGLTTGQTITITNVGGNRVAHGTFTITVVDANNFSLNGTVGVANWTAGGQFFVCLPGYSAIPFNLVGNGQYSLTIDGSAGLVNGEQYMFVVYCTGGYRDLYNEADRVTAQNRGT